MKKTILIFTLSLITGGLFAYNYLIDAKVNGLNMETGILKYYSREGIKASLGYTINGRFSFDAHFSYVPLDTSQSGQHTSLGSELSYMILKQGSGKSPLNLELASFYDLKTDNYSLDLLSISHVVGIGTYLSHKLTLDENLSIIPSAGLKWENEYIKYLILPEAYTVGPWPTHNNYIVATLQGTVMFKRFYAFAALEFLSDASSWDRVFAFYRDTLHLGLGVIL